MQNRWAVVWPAAAVAAVVVALGSAAPAAAAPAATGATPASGASTVDAVVGEPQHWVVAHGSDVVEWTAALDLAEALTARFGEAATAVPVGSSSDLASFVVGLGGADADPDGVVVLGTTETNPLVAAEAAAQPFDLAGQSAERFALRGEADAGVTVVYDVGATPKGAQVGAVRLKQQHLDDDLTALAATGAPAFRNRVGGHVQTQGPPPGWTLDDQAQYYVDHNINVVWGEKYGPPLPADVLERYGLGLALEATLPPVPATWWDDPANASAAYYRDTWSGQRRVVSPFDPVGRQAYYDAFRAALDANPSTAILYTLFGDYSFTTDASSTRISDGQPCGCTAESSALEVMKIMKQAIDDAGVDVTPAAWLWHLGSEISYDGFMRQLKDLGIGAIYNEAGDSDDWVTKRTNFDATALKQENGTTAYGPSYAVLVSAGGSCESVDPALGIPTPHAAASKIAALADAGVENFFLWWGSGEGWTYSANMSVVREMVMDPEAFDRTDTTPFDPASPEPLLARVAEQDFGALAPEVLRFWGAVDAALVSPAPDGSRGGLQVHSWNQRIGVYTLPTVFGGGWDVPLTPAGMANRSRFSIYENWSSPATIVSDFESVVQGLRGALTAARGIPGGGDDARLDQMLDQTELYTHLFASQTHLLQAIAVAKKYWVNGVLPDLDSAALRAELEPIAQSEVEEMRQLTALFAAFPANASLTGSSRTAFENKGDRDKDLAGIDGRVVSMQLWLDSLVNVAVGKPVTASPGWQPNRQPENAVDGNLSTLWHSAVADNQWIAVDLGEVKPIPAVIVRWNGNAPAKSYRLEVADTAAGPWRTVADVAKSSGGTDAFSLTDASGRYVRVYGLTRASVYGFAINELEVYGPAGEPDPDPDPDPDPEPISDGPYQVCRGTGSDAFDGTSLDTSIWSSSLRLGSSQRSFADGALRVPTYNASFDTAPFILQPIHSGAWEMTTALSFAPSANYHQAGLILWASPTRYLKVDLFSSGGVFLESTGKGFTGATSVQVPAGAAATARVVWLRLTSDGTNVVASRSADEGATWSQLGSPVSLAALGASSIGVYALQGATGATPTTATFHWATFKPTEDDLEACRDADPLVITPTVTPDAPESGWYQTGPSVTLAVDGFQADEALLEYRLDGGEWTQYSGAVVVEGDGAHELGARATLAGEVRTDLSLPVQVDGSAPVTTVTTGYVLVGHGTPRLGVTLTATDAPSGVARTEYSLDDGSTWAAYDGSLEVSPIERYTLLSRSVDVAGNVEEPTQTVIRPSLMRLAAWLVCRSVCAV